MTNEKWTNWKIVWSKNDQKRISALMSARFIVVIGVYCLLLSSASTFMNKLCSSLETECWSCSTKAPAEREKITRSAQTHAFNKPLTTHSTGRGLTCHSAYVNQVHIFMHFIKTSQRRGEIMNIQNLTYSRLCRWLKEQRGKSKHELWTIAFKRQINGWFHHFTSGIV